MTAALARVAELFYEPAATSRARPGAVAAVAPAIAVLAAPDDLMVAAAAIGSGLARRARCPAVVICRWGGGADPGAAWRATATPAARRLAAALASRGHDAHTRGRLVVVRLADAEGDAVAQARDAAAAGGGAPVVLALGRPRGAAFEEALAMQDLVIVASRGDDLGVAAIALSRVGVHAPVAACELPAGVVARTVTAGGFTVARPMRQAVERALEGLR